MAVYVLRGGVLVNKATLQEALTASSAFPTPRLSRLEPYASPIDGKEITSWAARDKDLRDSGSYDPRDGVKHAPRERPDFTKQLQLFPDAD